MPTGLSTSATCLALLVPASVIVLDVIRRLVHNRRESDKSSFPPGPTPVPILGNVLSLNRDEPWKTYTEWQAAYGNIVYARFLDQEVIILSSQSDAVELLEKRSRIYSDRPVVATIEPHGLGYNFAFMHYGDHWRLCRRIFHHTFRADAAVIFRPMQLRRARQMIINMIDDPDQYASHFSTFSAAVVMSAVYDYEPIPRNDPMVHIVDSFLEACLPGMTPENAILLKTFPFLLRIPDWLPGSSLKRRAKTSYDLGTKMVETPYQYVQKRMAAASRSSIFSMVSDHTTRMQTYDESYRPVYERALKHASATAVLGSTETTSSSLMIFTLAMVQNPPVWKRAQAEIDAVLGLDNLKLPDFDDRPSLPYVEAVLRETLRWQPVAPVGVPHATSNNDVYKGATVIVNIWAISRDEARYPNAEQFIPERFLNADGTLTDDDPSKFIFGFGRRICAGRYTADASLWSAIATMLATLDFSLAKDAEGKEITPEPKYLNGLSHHPVIFPCHISPRAHVGKEFLERVLAI
ncbi:cytochrome P450 [Melanogaster broomeanus]|nr:cytochrome P450 [Melanogaster broomeanus]